MTALRGCKYECLGTVASHLVGVDLTKAQSEGFSCIVDSNCRSLTALPSYSVYTVANLNAQLIRSGFFVVGHDGIAITQIETCLARTLEIVVSLERIFCAEVSRSIRFVGGEGSAVLNQGIAVLCRCAVECDYRAAREAGAKFAVGYDDLLIISSAKGDVANNHARNVNSIGKSGVECKASVLVVVGENVIVGSVALDACTYALVSSIFKRGTGVNVGGFRHAVAKCERVTRSVDLEGCGVSGTSLESSRVDLDLVAIVDADKACCIVAGELQTTAAVEDNRLLRAVVGDRLVVLSNLVARFSCALRRELEAV